MSRLMTLHPPILSKASIPVQQRVQLDAAAAAPQVQMMAQQNSMHVATVNPMFSRFNVSMVAAFLNEPGPRSSFQLPVLISPPTPNDQTLFEDPGNAANKYYLPAFGVAETPDGGRLVSWVSLAPVGTSSTYELTVHLADKTPSSLASGNIPARASAAYELQGSWQGIIRSWSFGQATTDGTTVKLVLDVQGGVDRDILYYVMTDPAANAQLIIHRTLRVAQPVPPAASAPAPAPLPQPHPVPIRVFHPNPVVLSQLSTAVASPPPPPLYRAANVVINSVIPFYFDKDLNRNIFVQVTNIGNGLTTWNMQHVTWIDGREYAYYQDRSQPDQIYFLPDHFKISRSALPPYSPSITVATNGQDPNSLTLTMSFLAVPVWDPARLAAAAPILQQRLSPGSPVTLSALFNASPQSLALSLNLPSSDASGAPGLVPQPAAMLSIVDGISASVTLKLPQFQQVYNALFDQVSPLASGQLTVTVGDHVEVIPVSARASDFVGEIFIFKTAMDTSSNSLVVTLQNGIESPIHIDALPGQLMRGQSVVAGAATQISPPLPLDLAPAQAGPPATAGDACTAHLSMPDGETVDASYGVLFDRSKVHVMADPNAIWNAIVQNKVVSPVTRQVAIRLVASVLGSAATGGGGTAAPVIAVQLVFDTGQTVTFDKTMTADGAGFLNASVGLSIPVGQYVLQQAQSGAYKYRVDLVTAGGISQGQWITGMQDAFIVTGNSIG